MINLLVAAAPVLLWLMVGFYTVFFIALLKLFQKNTSHKIPLMMAAITFGLLYDAFILALGTFLGDSPLLKTLSYPRYILHGCLIPLMLVICVEALEANKTIVRAVGVITAVLMIAGAVAGCKVSLKALDFAGVTRFVTDNDKSPKWAGMLLNLLSIVPTLILIVCGIVLWKKKGKKELTLSGLLMFVFSAIAPATGAMEMNFLFSMFGEVGMVLYFWLFAKKEQIEE